MNLSFKILTSACLAFLLSACSGEKNYVDPIQQEIKSFDEGYKKGFIDFGLSTVAGQKNLNITNVDCLVFNETAKKPIPDNLGELTAFTQSLKLRYYTGCDISEKVLVDFESARRVLNERWNAKLDNIPYSSQITLKNHDFGKTVNSLINSVTTEQSVCIAHQSLRMRQSRISADIDKINKSCKFNATIKEEEQCKNIDFLNFVHKNSIGIKDEFAWVSLVASNWKSIFLTCDNSNIQNYIKLHQQTPKEYFQKSLYRLSFPQEALMQCTNENIKKKKFKKLTYKSSREWGNCAKKLFPEYHLALSEDVPNIITPDIVVRGGPNDWLYDPTKASLYAEDWNFNTCEKEMIQDLFNKRVNIPSPEKLKYQCKVSSRRQNKV